MVFTSLIFMFVFSPICITGYYLLIWVQKKLETVRRFRLPDVFLTLASIGFYGWAGMNDLLGLCIFVVVVYLFGRWIQYAKDKNKMVSSGSYYPLASLFLLRSYTISNIIILLRVF